MEKEDLASLKKRHKQFALIISDIDSSEKTERFLRNWVIKAEYIQGSGIGMTIHLITGVLLRSNVKTTLIIIISPRMLCWKY